MNRRLSALAVSAVAVGGFFVTSAPTHAALSADRGAVTAKAAVTCNEGQMRQQIANLKSKAAKLKQLGRPRRPGRRWLTRPLCRRGWTRASRPTRTRASRSPGRLLDSSVWRCPPRVRGGQRHTLVHAAVTPVKPRPPARPPSARAAVSTPPPLHPQHMLVVAEGVAALPVTEVPPHIRLDRLPGQPAGRRAR